MEYPMTATDHGFSVFKDEPKLDWENCVNSYQQTGQWDSGRLGPGPGQPGCRAPAHILRAYCYLLGDGHDPGAAAIHTTDGRIVPISTNTKRQHGQQAGGEEGDDHADHC